MTITAAANDYHYDEMSVLIVNPTPLAVTIVDNGEGSQGVPGTPYLILDFF